MVRSSNAPRLLGPALGLILTSAVAAAAQEKASDKVYLKGDTIETGEIQSEDWSGLSLKAKSGSKLIPWDQVLSVDYAEAPEELAPALSAVSGGRLEEAQKQLEGLEEEERLRPVVRQQVLFHLAWLEQRTGEADAFIERYRALLEAFPAGRYLRPACESVCAALAARKDFAGAMAFLDTVAQAAKDPGPQAEIALVRGRLFELQKMSAEARAQYEAAEKTAGVPPTIALEAQLGQARCLVLDGKASEAEPTFRELTKAEAPGHVLAGAWNGLADITSEEGRAKRDMDRILEAAYGYLRGVVQYKPGVGEPTLEHQRALAGVARCFRYISELEQNSDRKRLYADRSRTKLDELKKEYPISVFLEEG